MDEMTKIALAQAAEAEAEAERVRLCAEHDLPLDTSDPEQAIWERRMDAIAGSISRRLGSSSKKPSLTALALVWRAATTGSDVLLDGDASPDAVAQRLLQEATV